MKKAAKDFLLELLAIPSPTGFEIEGQRKWAERMRFVADRVENDAYGSAWAALDPAEERQEDPEHPNPLGLPFTVLLEAHADEIGFMIKHVTGEGFLHVDRIGGSDPAVARARRVSLLGDKGPVFGVIGHTAIHLRERNERNSEKAPEMHELYVDVGAGSRKDVEKLGLRVGHPAVYADRAEMLGPRRLVGRALDNRIGGFICAEVMERLARGRRRPRVRVIALNSVQEETGGYGARMASYRLMPDVCVVLDVTHATDSPGIEAAKHGRIELGAGPSITHGSSNHPLLVQKLMSVAKKLKIPFQHEASSHCSGTDTDSIFFQRTGIPSALVSIPLRYMHSVVEVIDLEDVEKSIDLLVGFVEGLKPDDDFALKL
ncbi:MAG TPA: M20/M25/M40 family metallo-hydrolase [Verrucomicrobiales bacterium]|nr:M20/M25/M40 family metallo-hydrolase [Verrucomicrobiales bacterium]